MKTKEGKLTQKAAEDWAAGCPTGTGIIETPVVVDGENLWQLTWHKDHAEKVLRMLVRVYADKTREFVSAFMVAAPKDIITTNSAVMESMETMLPLRELTLA